MIDKYKGKINIDIAKMIISDHFDVYLDKENPCSRTICSHYELDQREFMSQADRPKPFQPRGAVDGAVVDTNMAKNMSFSMRWGSSCGIPFIKDSYCDQHRQFDYLRPWLKDRPEQPWTDFTTYKGKIGSNAKTIKKRAGPANKRQTRRTKL
jgi:hypothetical protein